MLKDSWCLFVLLHVTLSKLVIPKGLYFFLDCVFPTNTMLILLTYTVISLLFCLSSEEKFGELQKIKSRRQIYCLFLLTVVKFLQTSTCIHYLFVSNVTREDRNYEYVGFQMNNWTQIWILLSWLFRAGHKNQHDLLEKLYYGD